MTSARLIALCIAAVGLLTLVDIGLRVQQHHVNAFAEHFAVVPLHTNDTNGILIMDRAKNQPLWGIWNFKGGDSVSCFVEGKLVLGVTYVPEGRTETEVNFYGKDAKLSSQWRARENGEFYARTFFGENSANSEVWLSNRWHNVEVRTDEGKTQSGIVLDGRWRRVMMLTNGVMGVRD
jgi:hypothetical protein